MKQTRKKLKFYQINFSSVFTREPAGQIPTLKRRETIMEKMGDIRTTEDEVRKILTQLKVDKSPGPDNIHPYFLKEMANELAIPLNIFFNKSPLNRQ